jgi:hypothetical protein
MLDIQFTPSPRILRGLDEIGRYLKVSRRTVGRWLRELSLPAMQGPSGAYMTSTALIDIWIIAVWNEQLKVRTGQPPSLPLC